MEFRTNMEHTHLVGATNMLIFTRSENRNREREREKEKNETCEKKVVMLSIRCALNFTAECRAITLDTFNEVTANEKPKKRKKKL